MSSSFRGASAPPGGRRWTGITQATRDGRDAGPQVRGLRTDAENRSRLGRVTYTNVVPKERAIRTGVPTASRRNDDDDAAGHRG
jgi:hypothetical protein